MGKVYDTWKCQKCKHIGRVKIRPPATFWGRRLKSISQHYAKHHRE